MITVLSNSKELMEIKHDYENEKGEVDMCEAMKQWKKEERAEGRKEGRTEGRAEGEDYFATLTEKLLRDGRTEDLLQATGDKAVRGKLYREYGIKIE